MNGWTVIVTRPRAQAQSLTQAIAAAGGEPWVQPLIETTPSANDETMAALQAWSTYDAVVLTSANAIRSLSTIATNTGVTWSPLGPACYVIGKATAQAAKATGLRPCVMDEVRTQVDLAEALVKRFSGRLVRVLCPIGDKADGTLARRLIDAGHDVTVCVCYQTTDCAIDVPTWQETFARGRVGLLFFSPSAVESLRRQWEGAAHAFPPDGVVVCVGPTTAATAKLWIQRVIEAPRPDTVLDTLAEAIAHVKVQSATTELDEINRF